MKNSKRQAESKNAQEFFCTCFFENLYSKKIGFQKRILKADFCD